MTEVLSDAVPALTSLFATAMIYLIVRINTHIRIRTGKEVEAFDRATLHSALQTGAELAIALARKDGRAITAASEDLVMIVLNHVRSGSPDAVSGIPQARGQVLENLATVAIQRQIDKGLVLEGSVSPEGIVNLFDAVGQINKTIPRK